MMIRLRVLVIGAFLLFSIDNSYGMEAGDQKDDNSFRLRYGQRGANFTKSSEFIAIKPTSEGEGDVNSLVARTGFVSEKLQKFYVVKLKDVDGLDREISRLRGTPIVDIVTHVFHTTDDAVPFVPTGTLHVRFKKGAHDEDTDAFNERCSRLLDEHSLAISEVKGPHEFLVRVQITSQNPLKVARVLQKEAFVEIAEPKFSTPIQKAAFSLPKDRLFPDQWHLRNTGFCRGTSIGLKKGADARVVEAWEQIQSFGSTDVTLAIIDDGFDLEHPDIGAGRVVFPRDFTRDNDQPLPDYGLQDWHGTACAGVALGCNGGGDIVGAAPQSKFMPIRWGDDLTDTEKWFDYARSNGADIISCSWGAKARYYPLSTLIEDAIHEAALQGRDGKGIPIFFAAGNENRDIDDPGSGFLNGFAAHPDVIAVAASTSRDLRAPYSNFGNNISITAPSNGVMGILTADVRGSAGYSPTDYTYDFGGTSSATPLAAGVAALILSVRPDFSGENVKRILQQTARKISGETGFSPYFGYGCVNALEAVRAASTL